MRKNISESIKIPEGISCEVLNGIIKCKKGSLEVSRNIEIPRVNVSVKDSTIIFQCNKGSKKEFRTMKSYSAHLQNMFKGLNQKFTYILEICNVHFPITVKVDKNKFIINNFLGEKTPRIAKIPSNVTIEVKAPKIFVTSHDIESAGEAATNFEKATKIRNRDRRIFQDGIFIVERPGRQNV